MSQHRCHCRQPATWTARVVPAREVVLVEGHLPEYVLAPSSVDTWAACDEHVAEAMRNLVERNDMAGAQLVLRREGEED